MAMLASQRLCWRAPCGTFPAMRSSAETNHLVSCLDIIKTQCQDAALPVMIPKSGRWLVLARFWRYRMGQIVRHLTPQPKPMPFQREIIAQL